MSKAGVEFTPRVRQAIYERDLWRCAACGRPMPDGGDVHHRRLRSQRGKGDIENGVLLCGSGTTGCHGVVHQFPKNSREEGMIVPSWNDPAAVPIRTWRGWGLLTPEGEFVPETDMPPAAA